MPMPSFFGGRRRAFPFDAMNPMMSQTEQKPDIPTGEVTARSGVRGLFSRKSLPNTLNVIGAGLRQMDGGNELDEYLAGQQDQQYQRDMFGMRTRAQKQEEGDAERTRQERLAAVGALPENLRPFGSLAVEPYLESLSRGPSESYGDLERIDGRLGQRNAITGQYDWAPQVPGAAGPAAPSGYQFTPDGQALRAIEGGPADARATAEGRARLGQMDSSTRSLQNAISALDDAERLVNGNSTGFVGQLTRGVGGTPAYNLNQALEPVRAILSFETLAEMRRNSATGGALGSIAVRELELLGNTMRSLDTAQGEQQVRAALRTTRTQLQRTLQAIEAARAEMQGGGQQAPAGGGDGVRVIELEPE
jgi:hypothetical protein